jgi:hypothetical protein
MKTYAATDVFTPTGVPTVTYVYRQDQDLESQLRLAVRTPGLIVSLSGPSKSGKTVLMNKVIPKEDLIPVSGASIRSPEVLWDGVLSWMEAPSEVVTRAGRGFRKGFCCAHLGVSEKSTRGGIDHVVREIGDSSLPSSSTTSITCLPKFRRKSHDRSRRRPRKA